MFSSDNLFIIRCNGGVGISFLIFKVGLLVGMGGGENGKRTTAFWREVYNGG